MMDSHKSSVRPAMEAGDKLFNPVYKSLPLGAALAVSLITFIIYLPALQNGFVNWDDNLYVYENQNIISINIEFLRWSTLAVVASLWHPLTIFSFAVDYAIWGLNPFGYHLTNILLHTANTFLVFKLIVCLIEWGIGWRPPSSKRRAIIAAFFGALLFGINPLRVESVVWVSERKDVLCAFFFLLSLLSYLRYASTECIKKRLLYAASLISFSLALLSKPMAVSLPLVLLILDFYPLKRLTIGLKGVMTEKLPFFLLSILSLLMTIWSSSGAFAELEALPLSARICVAVNAWVSYLLKIILPFNLAPFYPLPLGINFFTFEYMISFMLLIMIAIFCMLPLKRDKLLSAIWLYYSVTLIPVLGIIKVGSHSMADRYTYLPSIGPYILVGLFIGDVFERCLRKRYQPIAVVIITIFMVSFLSIKTVKQITVWYDSITLWSYEIKMFPGIALPHNSLGAAYEKEGRWDEAMEEYRTALRLKPGYAETYNNFGLIYAKQGRWDEAIEEYKTALRLKPDFADSHNNLGFVYAKQGQWVKALEEYRIALRLKPDFAKTYYNIGNVYAEQGRWDEAIEEYKIALRLKPDLPEAHYNLGLAYAGQGRWNKAIEEFKAALRLKPDYADAHNNLGIAYGNYGQSDKAIEEFRMALRLKPDFSEAHYNLGLAYKGKGLEDAAIMEFKEASRIKQDHAGRLTN